MIWISHPTIPVEGATVFVILILGALVVALAIWLEAAPLLLPRAHLLVSLSTIIVLASGILRPFKGILIGLHLKNLHHKYEAREDG